MTADLLNLDVSIEAQPDDVTCGPTCLHAVYRHAGMDVSLQAVIDSVPSLPGGGCLEVNLGCDALRRGLRATIHTFNLHLFDPTWFGDPAVDIAARLRERARARGDDKFSVAADAYCEFLELGGRLRFADLTRVLLRGMLKRHGPIIAALNVTYLYRQARVSGPRDEPDDIHGEPCGHFVVLSGYNRTDRSISIADPWHLNPVASGQQYAVHIDRVIGAVLLGVMTYDASLLLVERRA